MKPEHINMARDAIAARKTYGSGRTADNNPSQRATESNADYLKLSIDPNCGWEAALNEIDQLKAQVARREERVERLEERVARLEERTAVMR